MKDVIERILTLLLGPKCRVEGCPLRGCPLDEAIRRHEWRKLHGFDD